MERVVRAAALVLVAIVVVLVSPDDGRAQEAGSTLTITVVADGATPEDVFGVSVFRQNGTTDLELSAGVPVTIDVDAGEIALFEFAPAGWSFGGLECTGPAPFEPFATGAPPPGETVGATVFDVPAGVDVDCVFSNDVVPVGVLRMTRSVSEPNPDPLASHQVAIGSLRPAEVLDGEVVDFETNAGRTVVSDLPAAGFGTFIIDCGDAVVSRFGPQVEVDVPAGGLVECTAATIADPVATLTIEKLVEEDGADLRFPFQIDGFGFEITPSFAAGFGGVQLALGPGPYDVVERPSDGWFLSLVACSGFGIELIDQGFRIEPVQGRDVTCTFTNERLEPQPGRLGDANCDARVNVIDALVIAQFDAGVRTLGQQCPLGDVTTELFSGAGDVDDNGMINILDALAVARCDAGLPSVLCPAL